jgi:hypothetical protein
MYKYVSVLKQTVLPLYLSVLQQTVLPLYLSVLQQTVLPLDLSVLHMDEGIERDKTWGRGGLPTLPGLYYSTIQLSRRGFF